MFIHPSRHKPLRNLGLEFTGLGVLSFCCRPSGIQRTSVERLDIAGCIIERSELLRQALDDEIDDREGDDLIRYIDHDLVEKRTVMFF